MVQQARFRMMGRLTDVKGIQFCLILLLVMIVATTASTALAQSGPVVKMTRTITLNEVGDANITLDIRLTTNLYTELKTSSPNMAVLLRQLGAGKHWAQLENIDGRFDDGDSTVRIEYLQRGLARIEHEGEWKVAIDDQSLDLITIDDRQAILSSTANTALGLGTLIIKLQLPEGAHEAAIDSRMTELTYDLDAQTNEGNGVGSDFAVDTRKDVMSCLAKIYGNEKFSQMWTARSIFRNTGDSEITDYRVRFRIAEHSSWSRWARSEVVLPGQTVVDPFFPIYDLEKLAKLTGTRPASLEVEIEYRQADGRLVQESDVRRMTILSRNEAIFSSLATDKAVSFADRFDNIQLVLGSMVNANDPVIQQLAGGVSRLSGGAAASSSDDEAAKFLDALFSFMGDSQIAYQTPPGLLRDGKNGQHIKSGRDVLQNRAGTCVDLGVLFASTCEAVGLRPSLVVVPGHCFPAVQLPSGKLIGVEATMIGHASFLEAVKKGTEELREAQNGTSIIVDIRALRNQGVHSLDLPAVSVSFMKDLGYSFEPRRNESTQLVNNNRNVPVQTASTTTTSTPNSINSPFIGSWLYRGEIEGTQLELVAVLTANGQYAGYMKVSGPSSPVRETRESGTFTLEGDTIRITLEDGTTTTRKISNDDGMFWVFFEEIDYWIGMERTN
ncbi:MAG: hypothetical protein KDA42_00065 [Planctomycetales bacterium]|nr:hypothetical protein [Planctomycetales bacterium]